MILLYRNILLHGQLNLSRCPGVGAFLQPPLYSTLRPRLFVLLLDATRDPHDNDRAFPRLCRLCEQDGPKLRSVL